MDPYGFQKMGRTLLVLGIISHTLAFTVGFLLGTLL